MPKLWPALKFAFWTYFWTLTLVLLFYFVTEFSNRGSTGPEIVWNKPSYYWGILKSFCPMPLPIFPAALLGFAITARWGKALMLLLTPLALLLFHIPDAARIAVMFCLLPAAALASVPDLNRQRLNRAGRSRLSSPHD